jgi:pyruvyltransferase
MLFSRRAPRLRAYWWRKKPNFGDALNPLLIEGLSGLPLDWSDAADKKSLACIGSIIQSAKPGWVVWGAGCISATCPIPSGLNILALRGPLTRERLRKAGCEAASAFGDPGLLMPLINPLKAGKVVHDWGIIPHFTDFRHPAVEQLRSPSKWQSLVSRLRGRQVICINPLRSVRHYLKLFSRCRAIAASSLHGLVMAEAYGKPAVWVRFEDGSRKTCGIDGGEFKFQDFYQGIGKPNVAPLVVTSSLDFDALNAAAERWRPMTWDPLPLMDRFPEKTSRWQRSCERAAVYFRKLAAGAASGKESPSKGPDKHRCQDNGLVASEG